MHESRLVHSTHPPIDRRDANARVLCTARAGMRRVVAGSVSSRNLRGTRDEGVGCGGWCGGGARATGVGVGGGVGSARGVCDSTRGVRV